MKIPAILMWKPGIPWPSLAFQVWTLREVEQLLLMAQRGRELLGLPEARQILAEQGRQIFGVTPHLNLRMVGGLEHDFYDFP